jgi:hypothetical protein
MNTELEQLKALKAQQYEKFREQDKIASDLRHEWCETCLKIEAIERDAEVERRVAERLAGKVA